MPDAPAVPDVRRNSQASNATPTTTTIAVVSGFMGGFLSSAPQKTGLST
jgi:hypothetical protein